MEQYHSRIPGLTSDAELQWLFDQAMQVKSVVEVGSYKGRSTHALASGCRGQCFAVDTWIDRDIERQFKINTTELTNLSILPMDSVLAASYFREQSMDMIFIDGDHSRESIYADIRAWLPVCRILLCGHDHSLVSAVMSQIESVGVGSLWKFKK
jgi:hypothetical protein